VPNPNGDLDDADVTDRQIVCMSLVSVDIDLSAPIPVTFSPNTTGYNLETADGVQETRVTVTAAAGVITVAN